MSEDLRSKLDNPLIINALTLDLTGTLTEYVCCDERAERIAEAMIVQGDSYAEN